jgi:hypothetical protein
VIAERIPQQLTAWMLGLSHDPIVLLLLINVILFLVGLPVEAGAGQCSSWCRYSCRSSTRSGWTGCTSDRGDREPDDRRHHAAGGEPGLHHRDMARVPLASVFREITPFTLIMLLVVSSC